MTNKTMDYRPRTVRRALTVILVLTLSMATGCKKRQAEEPGVSSSPSTAAPSFGAGFWQSNAPILVGHPIRLSDLSESEIRFGIAPKRGPGVTYQDNIILMEHGDKAIQSFASDGMSWTLDANAPQVNEIQVGKILFATDRCAGKVLGCSTQWQQRFGRTRPGATERTRQRG